MSTKNIKDYEVFVARAVAALAPGSVFSVTEVFGEELTNYTIDWQDLNGNTEPTYEQIQAKLAEHQAERDAVQYYFDRKAAYPSLEEQLDMQYWDNINGTTVWADTIQAVKDQYPKPTE